MSEKRVIWLSLLSGGIYTPYWFYRTWKQYKDHTESEAYPVWHALALIVPVYNLFRMHAHVRVYNELILARGLTMNIKPVVASAAYGTIYFGGIILALIDPQYIERFPTNVIASLVYALISAWLVASVQRGLNRYWQSYPRSYSAPIGKGEVIFTAIGVLGWILVLTSAVPGT